MFPSTRLRLLANLVILSTLVVPLLSSPTPQPAKGSGSSLKGSKSTPNSRIPSPIPQILGPSRAPSPDLLSADLKALNFGDQDEASFEYLDPTFSEEEALVQPSEYGSYAIMSPVGRYLDYDPKSKSYLIRFKFGDARSERRWTGYTTHNPSFVFAHRQESVKGMGKIMEQSILFPFYEKAYNVNRKPGKEENKYSVQPMLSAGSGKRKFCLTLVHSISLMIPSGTEWYEIYLGQNLSAARQCKHHFWVHLDIYGQDGTLGGGPANDKYAGLDKDGYIDSFTHVLEACAKTPGQPDDTYVTFKGSEEIFDDSQYNDGKRWFDIIRPHEVHPRTERRSPRLLKQKTGK